MRKLNEHKKKLLTKADFNEYPVWGWDDEMENKVPIPFVNETMDKSLPSSLEEDNFMKNISDYDKRQLKLMHANLTAFETEQIELSSLVSSLEFLFNALEDVDEAWEEDFLKELTVLETSNALTISKESGEKVPEIEHEKNQSLVNKSIKNLKKITETKLNEKDTELP